MENEIDRKNRGWEQVNREIRDWEKTMEHEIDREIRDWEQLPSKSIEQLPSKSIALAEVKYILP